MRKHSIFLTVILIIKNQSAHLMHYLEETTTHLAELVEDYEIILIDNGSTDLNYETYTQITSSNGLPNLQVFVLSKDVDNETASWVGLENSLGDLVAILDPSVDDPKFISQMLTSAMEGVDVVFALNAIKAKQSFIYEFSFFCFNSFYRMLNGINLAADAPPYRLLSKRVVNFILQHNRPSLVYRHLQAKAGFKKKHLTYSAPVTSSPRKSTLSNIDRGLSLLFSSSQAPIRLVSVVSLLGALLNFIYSFYIVGVAFLKSNIAAGWASLALQQSVMFFLISLVLFFLGEYMIHFLNITNSDPRFHIGREYTSMKINRLSRLNVETQLIDRSKR